MPSRVHIARRILRKMRNIHMFSDQRLGDFLDIHCLFHLQVHGESVPMKDRRLYQQERGLRCIVASDLR